MTPEYTRILKQARAGNTARAWSSFQSSELGRDSNSIKALTLKGRLLKDLADQATGQEHIRLLTEARDAYLAANAIEQGSYPLINAATLSLLAGDSAHSGALAHDVLTLIEGDPNEGETAYWREATRAEALVLLDRLNEAQAALAMGIAKLPFAHEDQAATIAQFERILIARKEDATWLDEFRPPAAMHFSGLIGLDPSNIALANGIEEAIGDINPGYAFGALAAGADIMIAEAVLAAGAELHLVLPFAIEHFRAHSVEPAGGDWAKRFDAIIESAACVECPQPQALEEASLSASTIELATLLAMGLCLRKASSLRCKAHALTVSVEAEGMRPPIQKWQAAGLPITEIATHRLHGPQSATSRTGHVQSAAHLQGHVFISGNVDELALEIAQKREMQHATQGNATKLSGTASTALAMITDLGKASLDVAYAFLIRADGSPPLDRASENSSVQLTRAAESGQCLTDRQSAMIAKLLRPSLKIEEVGELATLDGPIEVWTIII